MTRVLLVGNGMMGIVVGKYVCASLCYKNWNILAGKSIFLRWSFSKDITWLIDRGIFRVGLTAGIV